MVLFYVVNLSRLEKKNFNPIRPGLFWGALALGGRGGGRKVPATHDSRTIHDIEMKFGKVVDNHKLINLMQFNWQITSTLRLNNVITVQILDFYKILPIKIRKV